MNKNIKIIIPMLLLLVLPTLASAMFYKYRDDKGILHYTDNLAEVPEDQRPSVSRYKEADDALTPAERIKKYRRKAAARNKYKGTKSVKKKHGLSSKILAKYKKTWVALTQEKAELVNEQQALFKFNYKLADDIEIKVQKKKIAKLNKRVQSYEKKRQRFELELAKYHLE